MLALQSPANDSLHTLRAQIVPPTRLDSLSRIESVRKEERQRATPVASRSARTIQSETPLFDSIFPHPIRTQQPLWAPFFRQQPFALRIPDSTPHLIEYPKPLGCEVFIGGSHPSPSSDSTVLPLHSLADIPRQTSRHSAACPTLSLVSVCIMVLLIVLLRMHSWPRFFTHCSYLTRRRNPARSEGDTSAKQQIFYVLSDLLGITSLSYFLWRALILLELPLRTPFPHPHPLLVITLFVSTCYLLRYLILIMWSRLAEAPKAGPIIWLQRQLFPRILWIFLFPLNLALTYSRPSAQPGTLYIGFAILAISLAYSWINVALTFRRKKYPPLHFFLYLCALEIAPILLAIRGLKLF